MPREVSALDKYPCPACGAQAEWSPTQQKLVCPFCGTESPYQFDRETGKVSELDLVTALREMPADERTKFLDQIGMRDEALRRELASLLACDAPDVPLVTLPPASREAPSLLPRSM